MSFREYLHEKAEESRHNETSAYMMFLAGAVFFIGGILETLLLDGNPSWFLFIPYFAEATIGTFLGLTLISSGLCLIIFGVAFGIHCSHDRSWYMLEMRKANSLQESESRRTVRGERTKKIGKA